MASEDVVIRFIIDDKRFKQQTDNVKAKLFSIENQTKNASRAFGSFVGNLASNVAIKAFGIVSDSISQATTNMIQFEKALVGVGKTTNLEGKQLSLLGKEIQSIAVDLPTATTELLQLTQNAAQLGVRGTANLVKFTKTAAELALTTDLSAQEASVGLAKLLNLTSESASTVDRLGSAFVDLGNNFATTEAAILSVSTEVARSTIAYKLSSAEVAGISTALSALGVQAEGGGTAIGRTFRKIGDAIAKGGKEFKLLQEITGETGDVLKAEFETKPIAVFEKFISGLGRSGASALQVSETLKTMGLSTDRLIKVITPLIGRQDLLVGGLERSRRAYQENTAKTIEAARQTATLDSDMKELGNTYDAFTERLLTRFGPAIKTVVNGAKELLQALTPGDSVKSLNDELEELSVKLIKFRELASSDDLVFYELNAAKTAVTEVQTKIQELTNQKFELRLSLANDADKGIIRLEQQIANLEIQREAAAARGDNRTVARLQQLQSIRSADIDRIRKEEQALALTKKLNLENAAEEEKAIKSQTLMDLLELENQYRVSNGELDADRLEEIKKTVQEEYQVRADAINDLIALEGTKSVRGQELIKEKEKLETQVSQRTASEVKRAADKKEQVIGNSLNTISGLMASQNETAFNVGKAAAIAQATINGHKAVTEAFGQSGPAGFILGPLVFAAVAAQIASIASTSFNAGGNYAQGGIVPGNSFSGDNVVANVNSAEMILNRSQQSRLFEMANGASPSSNESKETVVHTTVEIDGEAIGKAVSRQVADGLALGENI